MTAERTDLSSSQTQNHVVELIPGEHYVVFADGDSDALPDEDVIEELRILAYSRRNKGTLGPETIQVVETLAEAVAGGVLTNTVWAGCQEAKRFAGKLRSRRRGQVANSEDAAQRALQTLRSPQIPIAEVPGAADITVSGTADGTTWQVSCNTGGKPVELRMDVSGTVIDVMIGAHS